MRISYDYGTDSNRRQQDISKSVQATLNRAYRILVERLFERRESVIVCFHTFSEQVNLTQRVKCGR